MLCPHYKLRGLLYGVANLGARATRFDRTSFSRGTNNGNDDTMVIVTFVVLIAIPVL